MSDRRPTSNTGQACCSCLLSRKRRGVSERITVDQPGEKIGDLNPFEAVGISQEAPSPMGMPRHIHRYPHLA